MKKWLAVALIVLVAVFSFAAKTASKTEIEVWTLSLSPTFDSYLNDVARSFEAANP